MEDLQGALLDAVLSEQDAQGIVESAHRILRLPIIVFDVEFRPLAFAFERPFYYAPWEEIARGQGTEQFLEFLPNQKRIFQHGRSLLFAGGYDDAHDLSEVACAVRVGERLIGYVGIVIEDADKNDVLQANDLLAEVLSYYYSGLKQQPDASWAPDDVALLELLFETPSHSLVAQLQRSLSPPYLFAAVESDGSSIPDLQYIRSSFCRTHRHALGFVGGPGRLHLLFWRQEEAEGLEQISHMLHSAGNEFFVRSGVSGCFDCLEDVVRCRMQAVEALQAGARYMPHQKVHLFDEMFIAIACHIASTRYGDDILLPQPLKRLRDVSEGELYLHTAEVYLKHRSIAKTAAALGIHNNTLKYRMEKIETVTGMRLQNPEVQFQLRFGLQVFHLLQSMDGGAE